MKKFILIVVVVMLAGCHAPMVSVIEPVEGSSSVKIFRKTDPPASCEEIAPFSAVSGNGCGALGNPGSAVMAYIMFKNYIVGVGGNAGLITEEIAPKPVQGCWVNEYVINGVAYKCPKDATN